MKPLVSIIIPTYNRAHLINETLDSVLAQTYKNWECIVVDDGSTDHTDTILNEYCRKDSRFQYHHRPSWLFKGANTCRNYGFELSKGDYINWFDSDDLMHCDLLEKQIKNIKVNDSNYSICNFSFFRNELKDKNINPFNIFKSKIFDIDSFGSFISGKLLLNTPTILWKKESVKNVRYDVELVRAQDLDYVFKVLVNNIEPALICEEALVYVRKHEQSITDTFKNRNQDSIYSEINVRKSIWSELIHLDFSNEHIQGAFKMYLQSLKYLLYISEYSTFFNKMGWVYNKVNFKLKLLIIKLNILASFYIFTKKGITAYQKVINSL